MNKSTIKLGDIFGHLTVQESCKSEGFGRVFLCKCQCGNVKRVLGKNLKNGGTISCGCYKRTIHSKEPGVASWTKAYNGCKNNAKKRNILFSITIEEYKEIASKNCYYCGVSPKNFNKYLLIGESKYSESTIKRANIHINGIDRKNNDKGYILANCVPCCFECNVAKLNKTIEHFFEHVNRIVEYQKSKNV